MNNYKLKDGIDCCYFFSKEPLAFKNASDVEFKDGEVCHFTKYLHREDGPAISWHDGDKQYWWHGMYLEGIYTEKKFKQWKRFKNFQ